MVKTSSRRRPSPGSVVPTATPRTPGSCRTRSDQLFVEGDNLRACFVAASGRLISIVSTFVSGATHVHGAKPRVGLEEQAGGDEQDNGETNLKPQQHAPQPHAARPPL